MIEGLMVKVAGRNRVVDVEGTFTPAWGGTYWDQPTPAEYGLEAVYDAVTGKDLTGRLTTLQIEALADQACVKAEEAHAELDRRAAEDMDRLAAEAEGCF